MVDVCLSAMRFTYQRIETVLTAGAIDEQSRCRLIEGRDTLTYAVAHRIGSNDAAQTFLEEPDTYRVDRAHDAAREQAARSKEA